MTKRPGNDNALVDIAVRSADTSAKVSEIMAASGFVVAARLNMMGQAFTNPLDGNYRELQRMVPEKISALSSSGIALFNGIAAFQRDVAAQMTDMVMLMIGGVPSAARLSQLADDTRSRGTRAMLWPVVTGAATVMPVHRTVTSNARRLRGGARSAA